MRNYSKRIGGEMIEGDWNHCQIVERSLCGEREIDEQTFVSLEVLSERLERLKEHDSAFSEVEFSTDVRNLQDKHNVVAVG
jgi:hypothetical protein